MAVLRYTNVGSTVVHQYRSGDRVLSGMGATQGITEAQLKTHEVYSVRVVAEPVLLLWRKRCVKCRKIYGRIVQRCPDCKDGALRDCVILEVKDGSTDEQRTV